MCEEMDVQLYEPALALSVMTERGGTFVTEDDKQNAHRHAVNRSLPTPGGLMADVPCLDRSLDGC